ncbi:MAG: hypothetical protein IJL88_07950 [Clostridia bacterium]|nr:hypothetical protein [Clostridia bacterium]
MGKVVPVGVFRNKLTGLSILWVTATKTALQEGKTCEAVFLTQTSHTENSLRALKNL